MLVLVTYDVVTTTTAGRRRLRRVARTCQNFGQRVQFSVFECLVEDKEWVRLRQDLLQEIDLTQDSLRFYFLGDDATGRVEHHGAKPSIDFEDTLIV